MIILNSSGYNTLLKKDFIYIEQYYIYSRKIFFIFVCSCSFSSIIKTLLCLFIRNIHLIQIIVLDVRLK